MKPKDNYCVTAHFFYEIDSRAEMGVDGEGNPVPVYVELKVEKITLNGDILTREKYAELEKAMKKSLAETAKIPEGFIKSISRDDYLKATIEQEVEESRGY